MSPEKVEDLAPRDGQENKEPDDTTKDDGSVEVVIDEGTPGDSDAEEKPAEGSPEKTAAPAKDADVDDTELTPAERRKNSALAAMRINIRNLEAENARLRSQVGEKPADKKQGSTKKTPDEIDEALQNAPQSTVREISREEAARIVDEELTKREQDRQLQESIAAELNNNLAIVSERHPELRNENSVKSKIMNEVINEHPEWVSRADGPIKAMIEMESRLKEGGFAEKDKPSAKPPTFPKDRPAGKKIVVLTKADMDFCTRNNLDPKKYAVTKLTLQNNQRTVEV